MPGPLHGEWLCCFPHYLHNGDYWFFDWSTITQASGSQCVQGKQMLGYLVPYVVHRIWSWVIAGASPYSNHIFCSPLNLSCAAHAIPFRKANSSGLTEFKSEKSENLMLFNEWKALFIFLMPFIVFNMWTFITMKCGNLPGGPVARIPYSQCREPGSIPDQGTRSHMAQPRVSMPQLSIRSSAAK